MARTTTASGESAWFYPLYPTENGDTRRDAPDDPAPFRVRIEPCSGAEMAQLEAQHMDPRGRSANVLHRANRFVDTLMGLRVLEVVNYDATFGGKRYTPRNGKELAIALRAGPSSEWSVIGEDIIAAIRDESKLRSELPPSSASPSATG